MTIRRGRSWGEPATLPTGAVMCHSDAETAATLGSAHDLLARHSPEQRPTVGLLGGDLFRTLGGQPGAPRWESGDAMAFPIDVMAIDLDGEPMLGVAHVVCRSGRWWAGPTLVAMNAAFVGEWYLGPRAHPNDGLVDVTEGQLAWAQRARGRRRMTSGSHLPHPDLAEARVSTLERSFDRPRRVWVDGVEVGPVSRLAVRVLPDACTVVI